MTNREHYMEKRENKLYVATGSAKCMAICKIIQTGDRVNDRT